jgi:spore coat polysaccharide biosynthesis protein SpsF (cytidylyltransferase family)
MRWTIDEPNDLDFMRALLPELEPNHGTDTGFKHVLEVLSNHPEIANLNSSISRNEGWIQSLADDRKYDHPG